MKKCNNCNNFINDEAEFCPFCGKKQEGQVETPQANFLSNQNANNMGVSAPIAATPEPQVNGEQAASEVTNTYSNQVQNPAPANPQPAYGNQDEQRVNNNQNQKKKPIVPIVIVLVLIAAIAYIVIKKPFSQKEELSNFSSDKIIRVLNNGKFGYINLEGKVIVEPKYEYASDFNGNYAAILDNKEIIDTKGNVVRKYENEIEIESETGNWIIDGRLYDKSLKPLTQEGIKVSKKSSLLIKQHYLKWESADGKKAGIMTKDGKITYTADLQDGDYFDYTQSDVRSSYLTERYCIVRVEDKRAIVSCDTGKVVYDFTDSRIEDEDNNIFEIHDSNYDFVKRIYAANDQIAYETTDENGRIDIYAKGYISIYDSKNYNYKYLDVNSKKFVNYSTIKKEEKIDKWEEYTKMKRQNNNGKIGIVKGEAVVVPYEWNEIEYIDLYVYKYLESKGKPYVIGRKDEKSYLINTKTGKSEREINTDYLSQKTESDFIAYADNDTDEEYFYNLVTGKQEKFPKDMVFWGANYYERYVRIETKDTYLYYNDECELIYTGQKNK